VHIEALGLVLVGLPFAQSAMRVRRSRESDTAIHILEKPGNWAAEVAPPVGKLLTKERALCK